MNRDTLEWGDCECRATRHNRVLVSIDVVALVDHGDRVGSGRHRVAGDLRLAGTDGVDFRSEGQGADDFGVTDRQNAVAIAYGSGSEHIKVTECLRVVRVVRQDHVAISCRSSVVY